MHCGSLMPEMWDWHCGKMLYLHVCPKGMRMGTVLQLTDAFSKWQQSGM